MPGAVVGGDELHDAAVTPDEEMGRYAHIAQPVQPRVGVEIELVLKEINHFRAAKLPGRQADVVQHQQVGILLRRAGIKIGRSRELHSGSSLKPAVAVESECMSFAIWHEINKFAPDE